MEVTMEDRARDRYELFNEYNRGLSDFQNDTEKCGFEEHYIFIIKMFCALRFYL